MSTESTLPLPRPPGDDFQRWLRTEVPLNIRTMLFAFFVGTLLSEPLGFFLQSVFPHRTPAGSQMFYAVCFGVSAVALPFLCLLLGRWPVLRTLGSWTWLTMLFLQAILFPPIS